MKRRPSAKRVLGAVALAALLFLTITAIHRARTGTVPDPASDLDLPRLFARSDLTVADLEGHDPRGVPVLCYHYFRPGLTGERVLRVLGALLFAMPTLPDKDYWTTPIPEFNRQMKWLHDNGYRTIELDELGAWLDGRIPRPEHAVVITMDDGDESICRLAVPVLRKYGFHATVFMLTGRAGEQDWNEVDFATWEQLREAERQGVIRVESHTHDMHTKVRYQGELIPRFLVAAYDSAREVTGNTELARDLRRSRDTIRSELGHEARYLAWPFGFGSAPTDSLAMELGFRRVLTLRPVRNRPEGLFDQVDTELPGGLGRYAVTARTSMKVFRLMVRTAEEGVVPAGR